MDGWISYWIGEVEVARGCKAGIEGETKGRESKEQGYVECVGVECVAHPGGDPMSRETE
jgi:hypothetical protein